MVIRMWFILIIESEGPLWIVAGRERERGYRGVHTSLGFLATRALGIAR